MSVRTSKTRVAKNHGYGYEIGLPNPGYLGGDPYLMQQLKRRLQIRAKTPKGGKTITKSRTKKLCGRGYNSAALEGMGYNSAALEGMGYDTSALYGMGYIDAALRGAGFADIVTEMAAAIGPTAMTVIKKIANQLGESLKQLLSDPDKLLAILQQVAPKIWKKVKDFYKWVKAKITHSPEPPPRPKILDPDIYEPVVKYVEPVVTKVKEKIPGYIDEFMTGAKERLDKNDPNYAFKLAMLQTAYNQWKQSQNTPKM